MQIVLAVGLPNRTDSLFSGQLLLVLSLVESSSYFFSLENISLLERIYNSRYGNGVPAMFTSYSVVQLKGKHCRKPHCRNGVVGTFQLGFL